MSTQTRTSAVAEAATLVIGIYLRISDDREGRELGVDRQLQDAQAEVKRLGGRVYDVYKDNDIGASTRSATKVRKAYRRLLADAEAGRLNTIMAYTSGRLTRRPREHEDQIELAERYGVRFLYLRSPDFDLNTSAGRRIARILAANDAGEAEDISERVTRASRQRLTSGGFNGGRRPFGFQADGVTLEPLEAEEIAEASTEILAGTSLREIVRDLTDRGVPTVTGGPWLPTTLRDILTRPRNAGILAYHGAEVSAAGGAPWPAIVDEETFRAVVQVLSDPSRKTSPGPAPRWLGSCIYRCPCGATMTVMRSTSATPVYRCTNQAGAGSHVARNARMLDAYVLDTLMERLARPDLVEAFQQPVTEGVDLPALRIEAADVRERLTDLAAAFADGMITRAQLVTGTGRLTDRLTEVETRLSAAVTVSPLSPILGAPDVPEAFRGLHLEGQRAILKELLDVTVLPTRSGGGFDRSAVSITWRPQTVEESA